MSVPPPWTAIHNSPSSSPRQNVARRGVIVHHQAGTNFTHLRQLVLGQAGRAVSYTAICRDQQLELIISNDARRPWSVGDAHWDSAMRSVCLSNASTAGWTVSDATVWAAARAIAFWAQQDGFWPHRDGDPRTWTVLGHGEIRPIHGGSHPTACPGGVPLALVTARAQSLLTELTLEDDMLLITSPNRTPTLIGPGYFRELGTTEEVQQAEAIATRINGNDRQFDLWFSMAVTGVVTPPPAGPNPGIPEIDYSALVTEMRRQGLTVAIVTPGADPASIPPLEVDDSTHPGNEGEQP